MLVKSLSIEKKKIVAKKLTPVVIISGHGTHVSGIIAGYAPEKVNNKLTIKVCLFLHINLFFPFLGIEFYRTCT
jgi:hypothetical protein